MLMIGHSYGAFRLLRHRPHAARLCGFVGLNAFLRFPVPDRVLERMEAQLAALPGTVLAAFHDRCGANASDVADCLPSGAPHVERLRTGLRDMRLDAASWPECPALFLAGGRDPLLPDPVPGAEILREAGHLLPVTSATWCADAIAGFAATLS